MLWLEVVFSEKFLAYYELTPGKFTIGSSPEVEIAVEGSGLSRRHGLISFDGTNVLYVDQESTNGSFIFDDKLTPGKKYELNSITPVRLGLDVSIRLVDTLPKGAKSLKISSPKAKATPTKEAAQPTKIISLNDLQSSTHKPKSQTEILKVRQSLKTAPKRRETSISRFLILLISLTAATAFGFWYLFIQQKKSPETPKTTETQPQVVIEPEPLEPVTQDQSGSSGFVEARDQSLFFNFWKEQKCQETASASEKLLCQPLFGVLNSPLAGVKEVGDTFWIFIPRPSISMVFERLEQNGFRLVNLTKERSLEDQALEPLILFGFFINPNLTALLGELGKKTFEVILFNEAEEKVVSSYQFTTEELKTVIEFYQVPENKNAFQENGSDGMTKWKETLKKIDLKEI
jgi:pSer/pThr/pTyr-binding forkhead associated (FHA) protein